MHVSLSARRYSTCLAKGVIRMCVGEYIDWNGMHHPWNLEMVNLYRLVPAIRMACPRLASGHRLERAVPQLPDVRPGGHAMT